MESDIPNFDLPVDYIVGEGYEKGYQIVFTNMMKISIDCCLHYSLNTEDEKTGPYPG